MIVPRLKQGLVSGPAPSACPKADLPPQILVVRNIVDIRGGCANFGSNPMFPPGSRSRCAWPRSTPDCNRSVKIDRQNNRPQNHKAMKFIKYLSVLTCAAAVLTGSALAKQADCCKKAADKGEACSHKCCVAAAKDGKECEKCGGSGEIEKKKDDKKKDDKK